MKCPECKTKLPKNAEFCPNCSHQLTEEDKKSVKKKHKVLWFILGPILALILGFILLVFIFGVLVSSYQLVEIGVPNGEVDYNAPVPLSITIDASGMIPTTFEIPVYIDGTLAYTYEIPFEGAGMGEVVPITSDTYFVSDVTTYPGPHTMTIDEATTSFDVLTAADIVFSSDADKYYFITNTDFDLEYTVTNQGETAGTRDYTISLDGKPLDQGSVTVDGNTEVTQSVTVSSPTAGSYVLKINDLTYELPFYDVSRPETGKLMTNTVSGYSYIDIKNKTGVDLAAYLVESDNETVAIAAGYVRAGDNYTIQSIPHGEYYLIFQYGSDFVPARNIFYTDIKSMAYIIDMQANVVGGAGFATKYTMKMTQEDIDADTFDLGFTPTVPEQ